ncbi:MAG: ArsR family transcriptional regulator [Desulfobulbaceae bacterium]|nr:MAG: ArsR family transcriptional regulator [Desulfobulbaceae bacterium]
MNQDLCERRIIHEDRLEVARHHLLDYTEIDSMSDLFKAMADPGRLKILLALAGQEMCVCDLAALLGVSESAASHQIRILRTMNLVKNRREGQVLYYRLVDDHVTQLAQVARDHVLELTQGKQV